MAPARLRHKTVAVAFAPGFPPVALGPSLQNLLALLSWAVLGIVYSLCKMKEGSDREIVCLHAGWCHRVPNPFNTCIGVTLQK